MKPARPAEAGALWPECSRSSVQDGTSRSPSPAARTASRQEARASTITRGSLIEWIVAAGVADLPPGGAKRLAFHRPPRIEAPINSPFTLFAQHVGQGDANAVAKDKVIA